MFTKQQIFLVCFVVALIACIQAGGPSTRQFGNKKHPTLVDHCYYDDHNVTVKLHETVTPVNIEHECLKVSCGDEYVLTVETCQPTSKPCTKPIDTTKPFPDCCACH